MSSLPEGARRVVKTDGADPDDPDTRDTLPQGTPSSGGGTTKYSEIAAGDTLQRVGGQTGGKYPVERRSGETRSVRPKPTEDDDEGAPVPVGDASTEDQEEFAVPGTAAGRNSSQSERRMASTGISGLDAQYGGGLPSASLFLLTSEPTTATGVFAAQYAGAGLTEGEVVYYFSLEQPAADVRKAIAGFVKNEKDLERLRIIDGYPNQFANVPDDAKRRIGLGKGENALTALETLLVNPKLTGPVRIIVESMSELLAQYDTDRVFRALRVLKGVMSALDGTAVVTLVSSLHDDRVTAQAKHIADGIVEFHVERKGFGIYPYIAVTKMRGVTGSARLLLFKETETGLWLESTKRVF